MKRKTWFFALLLTLTVAQTQAAPPERLVIQVEGAGSRFAGLKANATIHAMTADGEIDTSYAESASIDGLVAPPDSLSFQNGVLTLEGIHLSNGTLRVRSGELEAEAIQSQLPGFLTLLPAIVAIALALLTRQVLISLFSGVFVGALLLADFNPLTGFLRSLDTYAVGALADEGHAYILLFSLCLAGLVGVITFNGGIRGIIDVVSRRARSSRSGQVSTWGLGLLIFFDDYANALIVGNTMRPFADRVRISREKLAFIVDSTAAPVATIGMISTWTAYQVGLIGDIMPELGGLDVEPYIFFLSSIPSAFYSFGMIALVLLSALTLRDFGPMRQAEARCRETGQALRPGAQPLVDPTIDRLGATEDVVPRWYNAVIPIGCVIVFTLIGLYTTGLDGAASKGLSDPRLSDIIGNSDSYKGLLWAAFASTLVAIAMSLVQRFPLAEILQSWVSGAKSLTLAAMILVLAWSVSAVCKDLATGEFVAVLTQDFVSPRVIPVLAFLSAGVIAFSTGTSYGTMAILIPILLPLAFVPVEGEALDLESAKQLGAGTLAAILGGSVFGDHCSPISDTTVLSSMSAGSDHIDHVRTQLPYATLVGAAAVPSYLLLGYGWSPFVILPMMLGFIAGAHWILSRGGPKDASKAA